MDSTEAPSPADSDTPRGLPAVMRALADDSRIRIMLLILETELAVGEIAQILGAEPAARQPPYPHPVRRRAGRTAARGQLDLLASG